MLKPAPQEMTKADICNVQLIHTDDLKDVFDSVFGAMTANVKLEEALFGERWAVAEPVSCKGGSSHA